MIKPVASILFGALFTTVTAAALGRLLLARLRIRLYRSEQWLFSLLLGIFRKISCALDTDDQKRSA